MLKMMLNEYIAKGDHRGKVRVLKHLLRAIDGGVARSRYGPLMRVRARDYTNFTSVIGRGPWIADYEDVNDEVAKVKPGMAFLDIGANAGLFSLIASPKVGPTGIVVAFEPSLKVFRDLVDNAALNDLRNFFPFNAAVGASIDVARFSAGKADHTGIGHLDDAGDLTVLQLHFDGLASIFDLLIGDRETMIKIDVEGAEVHVFESMRHFLARPQVKVVISEIDPEYLARFGHTAQDIYAIAEAAGLRPRRGIGTAPHYNEIFDRV